MRTMIVDEGRTDVLAWKCATQDFEFGTRLNVHESQAAVFFRDGQLIEVLGPGMHVLETRNFPFLRFFTKLRFGKYFHADGAVLIHCRYFHERYAEHSRI